MAKNQYSNYYTSKKPIRFYINPILPFISIILIVVGLIILYLYFFTEGTGKSLGMAIFLIIMVGAVPLAIFIFVAIKFWTVIEISEKGIKKSFLKIFFRHQILWEDILEVRAIFVVMNGSCVFFSKSSMQGLTYNDALKRKDQIHVFYSKKLYDAIKQFSNKEILNSNGEIIYP